MTSIAERILLLSERAALERLAREPGTEARRTAARERLREIDQLLGQGTDANGSPVE